MIRWSNAQQTRLYPLLCCFNWPIKSQYWKSVYLQSVYYLLRLHWYFVFKVHGIGIRDSELISKKKSCVWFSTVSKLALFLLALRFIGWHSFFQNIVRLSWYSLTEKPSSSQYLVNILQTALFTVIVRNIFTSCHEYPANKVCLAKKWSLNVCSLSYNRCIFAAKTLTCSSTRHYLPNICYKNLVLDTVRCIFATVTLTCYVFA